MADERPDDIVGATESYEAWLRAQTRVVDADLARKHDDMARDEFAFFRATYYRWAQLFPEVCPEVARAQQTLSVGDLHIENFGTWRDAEGRLVWGVNDFDESHRLSFANDLVRLVTSSLLATAAKHLSLGKGLAAAALLKGYTAGLEAGGRPVVLAGRYPWLRKAATRSLRDPVRFWKRMRRLPEFGRVPRKASWFLVEALPEHCGDPSYRQRVAGEGSLGHIRVVAVADWHGALVAREAKALVPSASTWAFPSHTRSRVEYNEILSRAVRCPDPTFGVRERWLIRRLAPDCSRVELASLPGRHREEPLIELMGWETANVHLATRSAREPILAHLRTLPARWLRDASEAMLAAVGQDWQRWSRHWDQLSSQSRSA